MLKKILPAVASFVLLACFSWLCPKRGIKSLSEIFENAKARYESTTLDGLDSASTESLREIAVLLKGMEGGGTSPQKSAEQMAGRLNSLVLKAGYTTRPALGEIILQYRLIGEDQKASKPSEARLKLLMARTYRLLAQELETTRFQV